MLSFVKTKVTKEKFYDAKRPANIWDVSIVNIVHSVSKLVEMKTNFEYLIGYLEAIRPLVLILLKKSGYVKTSKVKEEIDWLIDWLILLILY